MLPLIARPRPNCTCLIVRHNKRKKRSTPCYRPRNARRFVLTSRKRTADGVNDPALAVVDGLDWTAGIIKACCKLGGALRPPVHVGLP
jgi:hypothetical protein